jgi:hypothetical protein
MPAPPAGPWRAGVAVTRRSSSSGDLISRCSHATRPMALLPTRIAPASVVITIVAREGCIRAALRTARGELRRARGRGGCRHTDRATRDGSRLTGVIRSGGSSVCCARASRSPREIPPASRHPETFRATRDLAARRARALPASPECRRARDRGPTFAPPHR